MHPVSVVVVTWNSSAEIAASLRSVSDAQEIVVVDNGSSDGTAELIEREFPGVRLLRQGRNTGFAAGCNAGVAVATAPYVLFLNADAQLTPGYVPLLLAALERAPRAASAIGKLVYEAGGQRFIDSAGIVLGRHALRPLDRGHGELDRGQYDVPGEIFGPSAAAALYRRSVLGDAPFDEELFAYYEDVDLAWRVGKRGFCHLYVPSALAHHRRRGARAHSREHVARAFVNRYRVWLKNESLWRFATYAPLAVPWELARIARAVLSGEIDLLSLARQVTR